MKFLVKELLRQIYVCQVAVPVLVPQFGSVSWNIIIEDVYKADIQWVASSKFTIIIGHVGSMFHFVLVLQHDQTDNEVIWCMELTTPCWKWTFKLEIKIISIKICYIPEIQTENIFWNSEPELWVNYLNMLMDYLYAYGLTLCLHILTPTCLLTHIVYFWLRTLISSNLVIIYPACTI
jgi:hypothetical protein